MLAAARRGLTRGGGCEVWQDVTHKSRAAYCICSPKRHVKQQRRRYTPGASAIYPRYYQKTTRSVINDTVTKITIAGVIVGYLFFRSKRNDNRKKSDILNRGYIPIPIYVHETHGYLRLQVTINGEKMLFILDTGSPYTVINRATAQKMKLITISTGTRVSGINNHKLPLGRASVNMSVGDMDLGKQEIGVLHMNMANKTCRNFNALQEIGRVSGLIGTDFIRNYKAIISYPESMLYVQSRGKGKQFWKDENAGRIFNAAQSRVYVVKETGELGFKDLGCFQRVYEYGHPLSFV